MKSIIATVQMHPLSATTIGPSPIPSVPSSPPPGPTAPPAGGTHTPQKDSGDTSSPSLSLSSLTNLDDLDLSSTKLPPSRPIGKKITDKTVFPLKLYRITPSSLMMISFVRSLYWYMKLVGQQFPIHQTRYGKPPTFLHSSMLMLTMLIVDKSFVILASLVPRPISSFSMLHAEKREGLVREITCVTRSQRNAASAKGRLWKLPILSYRI